MRIPSKIINFLDKSGIKYEKIEHRKVFTAYDKAATLRVKPNIIGKTLILKTDPSTALRASSGLALVLVPGNKNFDKNKFKKAINACHKKQGLKTVKNIDFISEKLMKNKIKGVKIGAIPPFGALWKIPSFIDRSLINQPKIIFSSGDYSFSIKIKGSDFQRLIPDLITGNFSKPR